MNRQSYLDLERFGEGRLAYVRSIRSEDVRQVFPDAPQLMPGLQLYMLIDALGAPILLTDDRNTALANAREHALEMVSVH